MTETKQRRHAKRCARFQARRVVMVGARVSLNDAVEQCVTREHNLNRCEAKRFTRRHPAVDEWGRRVELWTWQFMT
jgi:hypothetical protein